MGSKDRRQKSARSLANLENHHTLRDLITSVDICLESKRIY
jgi:hypothetical protein